MGLVAILFLILTLVASALVGLYFFKINIDETPYIGFSYTKKDARSTAVLVKLQQVVKTLQESTCIFVKPAWANMKPTLVASGTAVTAVQGTCAEQKAALIKMMQNVSAQSNTSKIPLDDNQLTKIRAAIVELLTEVLNQTCVNDKLDVTKAITLMDETIAAFCP